MAKGHRSQIKRERNAQKDTRPSAKLSYARGMTFGKTAATKKAIVQLTEDSKEIEVFAGL